MCVCVCVSLGRSAQSFQWSCQTNRFPPPLCDVCEEKNLSLLGSAKSKVFTRLVMCVCIPSCVCVCVCVRHKGNRWGKLNTNSNTASDLLSHSLKNSNPVSDLLSHSLKTRRKGVRWEDELHWGYSVLPLFGLTLVSHGTFRMFSPLLITGPIDVSYHTMSQYCLF